jgi:hypothetical protein
MPNGIAVTRITPRNSKPANSWLTAGSGTEKPKLAKAFATLSPLIPPIGTPAALAIHAMAVPAAIATSPAGIPRQ